MNVRESALANANPSELARFAQIARVAAAKGWGRYAEQLGFGRAGLDSTTRQTCDAIRLREALEELGPTFVKFGQMLSQREDLFPDAIVAELRGLQDRAGSFPAQIARPIIEDETGRNILASRRNRGEWPVPLPRHDLYARPLDRLQRAR